MYENQSRVKSVEVKVYLLTLTCASIGAEGVASGGAGAVETAWCVGAAIGAHATSSRQSTLIDI